jgi:hypothetical protein
MAGDLPPSSITDGLKSAQRGQQLKMRPHLRCCAHREASFRPSPVDPVKLTIFHKPHSHIRITLAHPYILMRNYLLYTQPHIFLREVEDLENAVWQTSIPKQWAEEML